MLDQEHLTLRLVRLRATEQWSQPAGLAFVFPKGGAGEYQWGRQEQRLGPGDVAVLSNEPRGKLCVREGAEMVFWAFSLCLEHLLPLFAIHEIAMLETVVDGLKGLKFHPAADRLATECHRLISELPPQFDLDHRSQLLRIAASILAEEFRSARRQRVGFVRAEEHLVQAFEGLSTEQLLHLSVEELAGKFGCSRRHLNRLFHKHFGFSIVGLRMELRLLKAVSLLRDPSAKVIHVAEQSGFNHLGLFNSCFRRRFGNSPGRWRKQAAEGRGTGTEMFGPGTPWARHPKGLRPKEVGIQPVAAARRNGTGVRNGHAPATANGPVLEGADLPGPAVDSTFAASAETKTPAAVLLERCAQL